MNTRREVSSELWTQGNNSLKDMLGYFQGKPCTSISEDLSSNIKSTLDYAKIETYTALLKKGSKSDMQKKRLFYKERNAIYYSQLLKVKENERKHKCIRSCK